MTPDERAMSTNPENQTEREARYVEAMDGIEVTIGFRDEAGDDDWAMGTLDRDDLRTLARAVIALADQEVAEATAGLRAEVERLWAEAERLREHKFEWREAAYTNKRQWMDAIARAEVAESERDAARAEVEAWRAMRDAIQESVRWRAVPMLAADIYSLAIQAPAAQERLRAVEALIPSQQAISEHRAIGCVSVKDLRAALASPVESDPEAGAADTQGEGVGDGMCQNCVTPWKCNGPHTPTARSNGDASEAAADREGGEGRGRL